ncbi:membrane-associated protein, putative [Bodo saltans]|uniref:Membrane-associated protein, putative n=1 Tax=Bodo saltans TaxID=75058 RepID=A0A0S4IP52_BODSA|nr:membrane-associated protein, putative [Bodo saltans]|eukprot:CUE89141.1 membrane-associated protein, putative [Bodo saltans]
MESSKRVAVFAIVAFFLGCFSQVLFQNTASSSPTCPTSDAPQCAPCPGCTGKSSPETQFSSSAYMQKNLPSWRNGVLRDAVEFQSMAMRGKCSDKCTAHRYQEIYARTLFKFRESSQPSKLLEIGLGCIYDNCALGGPLTYMAYLPNTTYHALEIDISVCKAKYAANNVPLKLSTYIDEHVCHGSSADTPTVSACGSKFGPFDIVIDDGSHMLKHTSFSFLFWLKSPGLVPGGYLIIEDLQVSSMVAWANTALDYSYWSSFSFWWNAKQPAIARGTTVVNYAQSLLMCQLSSVLCLAPHAGEEHAMIHYVNLVDQIIVAPESVAFRKSNVVTLTENKLTSDMCIALDDKSGSYFDRKANVLVVRLDGNHLSKKLLSSDTAQHLRTRLGVRGLDVYELRLASCASVTACLASINRIKSTLDLIVVEVPFNSGEQKTWASQQLLIEILGSADFMSSNKLAIGGVVMIDGYQPRSIAVVKTPDAKSPRTADKINEPLLAFAGHFVMQQLVTVPEEGGLSFDNWAAYAIRNEDIVKRAIVFFNDVSIDAHRALYFRRGDPRHNRVSVPRDHL